MKCTKGNPHLEPHFYFAKALQRQDKFVFRRSPRHTEKESRTESHARERRDMIRHWCRTRAPPLFWFLFLSAGLTQRPTSNKGIPWTVCWKLNPLEGPKGKRIGLSPGLDMDGSSGLRSEFPEDRGLPTDFFGCRDRSCSSRGLGCPMVEGD
ncbi:hypothetical protein B0J18DRAFT_1621 [Chaetomium sp. MPI-SDFR-AT-0129]|nr:hypothetical protein B0J18DRAFT_1621 [Chaetomium sp. MPI-SDFR-AT-0129]